MNKTEPIRWILDGQACVVDGKVYATGVNGHPYCMGKEEEVMKTLEERENDHKDFIGTYR